ncbi:MAG: nitroreductase family deazaflavin-dependent oxidoreductase [Acidimicrobiia bacterium]
MGLAADLGYELGHQNRFRKSAVALGSTRAMSNLNHKILGPADRFILRLTRGKSTMTSWVTGIPPLWVTAMGARSGAPRTVPLLGIPIAGDLALLGTSFGQKGTPAWVHNLEAHPEASVSYRERSVKVRARPAEPAEAETVWQKAIDIYPGYGNYGGWAPHRRIRVFVLEAREGAADRQGD